MHTFVLLCFGWSSLVISTAEVLALLHSLRFSPIPLYICLDIDSLRAFISMADTQFDSILSTLLTWSCIELSITCAKCLSFSTMPVIR